MGFRVWLRRVLLCALIAVIGLQVAACKTETKNPVVQRCQSNTVTPDQEAVAVGKDGTVSISGTACLGRGVRVWVVAPGKDGMLYYTSTDSDIYGPGRWHYSGKVPADAQELEFLQGDGIDTSCSDYLGSMPLANGMYSVTEDKLLSAHGCAAAGLTTVQLMR